MKGRFGKARVVVLTILEEEFEAAQLALDAHENIAGTRAFIKPTSRHESPEYSFFDIVLYRSLGRSNGPCGTATRDVIGLFRPDYIILCGIAGGIEGRDNIALGDVVLADYIHYAEVQKLVEGKSLARHVAFDQPSQYLRSLAEPVRVSSSWVDMLSIDPPKMSQPKVLGGPLLASEKVLSDVGNEYQANLINYYDHCLAVDMESYGFCIAVFESRFDPTYNPQLLVIRGISDLIQEEDNVSQRQAWKAYACHTASIFTAIVAQDLVNHSPYEE